MEAGEPGFTFVLRDYVEAQNECDVFIEGGPTTMSNLLVSWLEGHGEAVANKANAGLLEPKRSSEAHNEQRKFIFDTHDQDIFVAVQTMAQDEGWVVKGPHYYSHRHHDNNDDPNRYLHQRHIESLKNTGNDGPLHDTAVVVYGRNAAATIHKAERLLTQNLVAAKDICLLLDTVQGMHQVRQLSSQLGVNISYICIAEAYDELFEHARTMVRQG